MDIFYQVLCVFLYVFFFVCVFSEIRVNIFKSRKKAKPLYKNIRQDLVEENIPKRLFKIIITFVSFFCFFIILGFLLFAGGVILTPIALPCMMEKNFAGEIFNFYYDFIPMYWSLLKYALHYFYILLCLIFTRDTYINVKGYKLLKDKLKDTDTTLSK